MGDTIAACATGRGTAAIAVVRLSGPQAHAVAAAALGRPTLPPRRPILARYRDLRGVELDELLATAFVGPASYTGEDVVELSGHGNPFIVEALLRDLCARGARVAEPGEFTRRAYLNRKLDLAQAEAVAEIIAARHEAALAAALRLRDGALSRRINRLRERLIGLAAQLEAHLDFPEEDLPEPEQDFVGFQIAGTVAEIDGLAACEGPARRLRDGCRVVLVGPPNAGKSTLFNALLGEDRSLVDAEPGTTRDFVEGRVTVSGRELLLVDTAGLREGGGAVERAGMERTMRQAAAADLLLILTAPDAPPVSLPATLATRPAVRVLAKADLGQPDARPAGTLAVSAQTGEGMEALRGALASAADAAAGVGEGEEILLVNARHAEALRRASAGLGEALGLHRLRAGGELAAVAVRQAMADLDAVTGKIDTEDVLDQLFARFCIGK